MTVKKEHRFHPERLMVDEWHSLTHEEWAHPDHVNAVQGILTPSVTKSLPPSWQGHFTRERAQQWVDERDNEGTTLLAVDKSDGQAVGLIVLFEAGASGHLRLGYMLKESAWGKGFASELIRGFVGWCRTSDIRSITGGVEKNNIASIRVLKKCGFLAESGTEADSEQMYVLKLS